jgi:hypothetical protein
MVNYLHVYFSDGCYGFPVEISLEEVASKQFSEYVDKYSFTDFYPFPKLSLIVMLKNDYTISIVEILSPMKDSEFQISSELIKVDLKLYLPKSINFTDS